jgi:hypothetical protein
VTLIALIFELTVTDNLGATDKDSVIITVIPVANIAPAADAGVDQSVDEQTLVTLSGSGSDSDGSVATFRWTQIAGQAVTLTSPNLALTRFDTPAATSALTLIFQLTVTDDEDATTTDTIDIVVNPAANIAPTADAGADQSVDEQTLVTLSGSGSDSDGSVATYRWTQIAGQAVTLTSPNLALTRFDAPTATSALTLTFQLTVTDNGGAATTNTVDIRVNPAGNIAPTANAGADQSVDEQAVVMLTGSGSDSDGSVATFRWTQIAGQVVMLRSASRAWTRFDTPAASTALTLIFQLTVTDNKGATTTDTVAITVNPAGNTAPTANAGPNQSVNAQNVVILSGSGTDSDGTVTTYRWTQIAGQAVTLTSPNLALTRFDAPTAASSLTLIFQLTVTDNEGATTTDTVAITVNPAANIAPTAYAGADQSVDEQTLVTLSGSGSDSDGTVTTYRWTQIAGQAVTLTSPNLALTRFDTPTAASSLTLIFQLTVTDNEGATTTDTVAITVNPAANIAPTAYAGTDQSVDEQTVFTLSGSGTDSDGTVTTYRWTQTAGQTVILTDANNAWASFEAPAVSSALTLTFQLIVTDNDDASANDSINITVNPAANIAPTANAGTDQSVDEQAVVMLTGSGTDSDGSVTTYRWTQIAGEAVILTSPNSASTSFDAPTAASALTLIFQLTVTDDDNATTTDTVAITVNPAATDTLIVTGENTGNNFVVSWNDVNAHSYRVLFWDNDGNIYGPTTTSLSLSITSTIRELGGRVVVEAYDALGNSVFSTPINVEAL